MKRCVFAGTFDPPTSGHKSVVEACLKIFDEVVAAVMVNTRKTPLLSEEQRKKLLEKLFSGNPRVKVVVFEGAAVDLLKSQNTVFYVRGVRGYSDFEYETADYYASKKLMPELVEIYIPSDQDKLQVSSTLVKNSVRFKKDLFGYVPEEIKDDFLRMLEEKMFERQIKIPEPDEIKDMAPMPESLKKIKAGRDKLITDVITGKSDKFIIIVGPCSAHEPAPVLDYVERLGKLNERVKDKLVLVPRIYTNKPRTKGVGYKGMFSQPDPTKGEDILKGILTIRKLNVQAIEASGLSAADEMLYPENYGYVDDILSYVAVGARSSENQLHRLVSSGVDGPVGIKNPMSGSILVMLNSIYAAQSGQVFKLNGWQVKTCGNPLAHAILRGAVDGYGNDIPNFHYEFVMQVAEGYAKSELANPAIIIDANHSNSGKKFKQQIRICEEVMQNRIYDRDFKKIVKGFMIESFIEEGNQKEDVVYGKSITDPCLGWDDTERLLLDIADKV